MQPARPLDDLSKAARRRAIAGAAALLATLSSPAAPAGTLTLKGVLTGADHQTYREVPFRVPAGTTAVTVDFSYTGKDQKAVIDLGVRDPQRFRGWSGGNKARFTLTETWATPSYLPGPLPAGDWKLILGVPNLRQAGRAEYTATITLDNGPIFHGFAPAPLKEGPGWYRGDLHLHTGHSDGACASRTGKRAPCPLFRTLEAAAARGLDFVAITEHNTSSHVQDLAGLQAYYDDLLLIPGREVTTFHGHMNVLGMTAPLDFQLGSPRAPTIGRVLDQADAAHALVSVNHPALPSGEACMGCGWTAETDYARIPAMEVVNGATSSGPLAGVAFWEARLSAGFRITAVGGSDNHDAGAPPARGVGTPTTVVHAPALSQDAILGALRAGDVFIDTQGTRDRQMTMAARVGDGPWVDMGGVLQAPQDARVGLQITTAHVSGGRIVIRSDYAPARSTSAPLGEGATLLLAFPGDGARHWFRAEIVGPDGSPWLIGNPIYLAGVPR